MYVTSVPVYVRRCIHTHATTLRNIVFYVLKLLVTVWLYVYDICSSLNLRLFSVVLCVMLIWQRLKNIGLARGPSGRFAIRLVTESGGLATNPPCDKPIEVYSTLHRGPRQGFVTEGPRQRYVTEGVGGGRGSATNPYFESQPKELLTPQL